MSRIDGPINRRINGSASSRRGTIAVLAAVILILLIAMIAFAVEIGRLVLARNEMQRSADAAALASAWELIDNAHLSGDLWSPAAVAHANSTAVEYVQMNGGSSRPRIRANSGNNINGDVVVGTFSFSDGSFQTNDPSQYNAVRVHIQRTASDNGEVPMIFGRLLGLNSAAIRAEATAYLAQKVVGFRIPQYDEARKPLPILPIALDLETWNSLVNGEVETDHWTWNENEQRIEHGWDGLPEVNLYPQDTGAAGNRGTVNIGTSNNSTSFLQRQIRTGVTESDLDYHGGQLTLDSGGQLQLGGNPGISSSIAASLARVSGEPRIILIFSNVAGSGNNAVYTIVKFAGVRIMEVNMSGGDKRVMIQPANVVTKGVITGTASDTSEHVFAPPYLVD